MAGEKILLIILGKHELLIARKSDFESKRFVEVTRTLHTSQKHLN